MAETHFTNLLIVVVVAFAAPFALGLAPRLRLPAVVLEIVAGIAMGPPGLKQAGTMPSPAAAILSTEDRTLCRTPPTTVGATA